MKILYIYKSIKTESKFLKKTEGLLSLIVKLRNYFCKSNSVLINKFEQLGKVDLVHIHSSGFSEIFQFEKFTKNSVYSLHSNVKSPPFRMMLDYLQNYWYFYDFTNQINRLGQLKRSAMVTLSHFIPVIFKRVFLNKPKLVVLPNLHTAQILKLKKYVVIHQGIDIDKFKKRKLKKSARKINLAFFGHPTSPKGLIEVISSFSKLSSQRYNKSLFLSYINKKIKQSLNKKDPDAKIEGFCKDIIRFYNDSDIVILPYRHSAGGIANPLVLLEAMACEKAIITTDLPHIREICGDSAVYVNPYSVKQIVKAVNFLAKRPELRNKLGKRARKRVVKYYNEKDMFRKYQKVYERFGGLKWI